MRQNSEVQIAVGLLSAFLALTSVNSQSQALVIEGTHLLAVNREGAEQTLSSQHRNCGEGARAAQVGGRRS